MGTAAGLPPPQHPDPGSPRTSAVAVLPAGALYSCGDCSASMAACQLPPVSTRAASTASASMPAAPAAPASSSASLRAAAGGSGQSGRGGG